MPKRPSKKTETIEVRLSPELKSALGNLSRGEGRSMSDMVRSLIEGEVEGPRHSTQTGDRIMAFPKTNPWLRPLAVALPILAMAMIYLVTAQSSATASEEARVFFAELDRDGNDRVTQDEVETFLSMEGWTPDPACGTQDEDPCTLAEMATLQLERVDSDGDGVAVFDEVAAIILRDRAADFLDIDFDENGLISLDELVAAEVYWIAEEPEIATEEGIELSEACVNQLRREELAGIAQICGFEAEARIEMAIFDANRDGRVSLMEFLEH